MFSAGFSFLTPDPAPPEYRRRGEFKSLPLALLACRRQHAAMDQGRPDRLRLKPRGAKPFRHFSHAIKAALGQREQGRRIESMGQRAIEGIIKEDVMDQQLLARGRGFGDERATLGDIPIVQNIGKQGNIGRRKRILKHIAGPALQAVGDTVRCGEFLRDLKNFGAIEHDGSQFRKPLQQGDRVNSGSAADVEQRRGLR